MASRGARSDDELVLGTTEPPLATDTDRAPSRADSPLGALLSGGLIRGPARFVDALWPERPPRDTSAAGHLLRIALQHLVCVGRTGVGKSAWLVSLIVQLINLSVGCLVIDPHGDLVDWVLAQLYELGYFGDPRAFTSGRLAYLDFANPGAFVPGNVLLQPTMSPDRIAAATMEAFRRAFPDLASGQAPLIESYIQYGAWALASAEEPLTQLGHLIGDPDYRRAVLRSVAEPAILDWFAQLEARGTRGVTQADSALRRLGLLLLAPELAYSLGATTNLLPMRPTIDRGTTLLCNLGGLPAQSKRLWGSMLTVFVEEAALSRADLLEEARRPYVLVIDEAATFLSRSADALETMLSQTRKEHVYLVAAVQYLKQFPPELRAALVNAALVSFRADIDDAEWLARRLGHFDARKLKYSPSGTPAYVSEAEQLAALARTIATLPPRQAVIRLGDQSIPFRSLDVPSPTASREAVAAIKAEFAKRLLVPREQILREQRARRARLAASPPSTRDAQDTDQRGATAGDGIAPGAGDKQSSASESTPNRRVVPRRQHRPS